MTKKKMPVWELDATPEDANWIKQGTWDLPPYMSDDFLQVIGPDQLDWFRTSTTYKAAVARGQIRDDKWVEDWIMGPPKNEGKQK